MTIFQELFDKDISDDKILDVLSTVFSISRKQIFLTNDIYQLEAKLGDNIELLCKKAIARGNFSNILTLYLHSKNLSRAGDRESDMFIQLCNLFNCECLISDNSPNPYKMISIKNNAVKNVSFVAENLDNEIYNIAEY